MLNLFRSNQLILGVFLLGYALLLRFWFLFTTGTSIDDPGFSLLSSVLWDWLREPVWLPALSTTVLIWIQALLINALIARNRLASELNLFPGLFYILVCSALPVFQEFSPIHLANTFLILAIGQLFRVYKQNRCMDHLFNSGLLVGLASLFYSPYWLFLIPILFGLNSLRAFRLREWLGTIIGALVPILWLLIVGFLNDRMGEQWDAWLTDIAFLDVQWRLLARHELIGLVLMGVLLLTVILNYNANLQKTVIEVRKKVNILYWILFFGFVVSLFSVRPEMTHLLTVAVPSGILLSFLFTRMSRASAELVHLFLFLGVILYHYLTYLGIL